MPERLGFLNNEAGILEVFVAIMFYW
jgi:hypothetical protein